MKKVIIIFIILLLMGITVFAGTLPAPTVQLKTYSGSTSNYSNDANVTVAISHSSTDVNAMRFSCNDSTWTNWMTYSALGHFDLNSGSYECTAENGSRTAYVQIRDTDFNVSSSGSDSIILDFASPAVTSFSPASAVSSGNGANGQAISVAITDDFNLSSISISLDRESSDIYDSNTTACTITGTSTTCTFTDYSIDRTGSYTYSMVITDMVGNSLIDTNTFAFTDTGDPTAPGKPTGYDINTAVYLSWSPNSQNDFNSYGIYRSTLTGFDTNSQTLIAYSDTNSYTNFGLDENTTYYYKISAFDFSGLESTASDQNAFTTDFNNDVVPTLTRTDVSCDTNDWCYDNDPTFSITGISNVEYSWIITTSISTLPADCTYGSDCNTDSTPEFSDITNGTNYFKVKACKPTGCSPTETFILKVDDISPSAPGSVAVALSGYSAVLTWTASTDTGGSGMYRYYIYRSTTSSFYTSTSNQIGYVEDKNLTYTNSPAKGETYYYKVQARDTAGNNSSSLSVTPVNVTIPSGGEETEITIKAKNSSGEYVGYYSGATDLTIEITFSKEIDDMNLYITNGDNNIEVVENMKDNVTTYSTAIVTSASYADINVYVLAFSETGWINGQKILYLDTENPTTTFSNLTTGQKISGIYNIQINATDNYDINDVKLYVDNNLIGYATNANDNNWVLDLNTFDYNNEITLKVIVTDGVGKTATKNIGVNVYNLIVIEPIIEVLTTEQIVAIIQDGSNKKTELEEKLLNCPTCISEESLVKKTEADKLLEDAEGLLETNLKEAKLKAEAGLAIYASLLEEVNKNIEISQPINPLFIVIPIIIIIVIVILFFSLKKRGNLGKGSTKTGPPTPNAKKSNASWDKDVSL